MEELWGHYHVFVNDPKKGYGIFIEWMLEESQKIVN